MLLIAAMLASPLVGAAPAPELVVQGGHLPVVVSDAVNGRIATGDATGVKIWDEQTGRLYRSIAEHGTELVALSITPDGKRVVSATAGTKYGASELAVFDVASGARVHLLRKSQTAVTRSWVSPDSNLLVASTGLTALVFDLRSGEELGAFGGYKGEVAHVDIDPKGARALVASNDLARVWSLPDFTVISTLTYAGQIQLARILPGRSEIVLAGDAGVVLYDMESGAPRRVLHTAPVEDPLLLGPELWATDASGALRIDLRKGSLTRPDAGPVRPRTRTPDDPLFRGKNTPVRAFAVSPDGAWLVSDAGHVWDLSLGRIERRLPSTCQDLEFLPDGRTVVCRQQSAFLFVDFQTGRELRRVTLGHNVIQASINTGSMRVVTQSVNRLHLIELTDGRLVREYKLPSGSGFLSSLALFSDGKRFMTGEQHASVASMFEPRFVHVWGDDRDAPYFATGIARHADDVVAVAVSPDGRLAASAGEFGGTQLHQLAGSGMHELSGHIGAASTLRFHEDGNLLATGGEDGRLLLIDTATRATLLEGRAEGRITSIRFTRDGKWVIAASEDGAIRIFDVRGRTLVATLVGEAETSFVAVTRDGHYRASKDALDSVGFRLGARVFGFEQFDVELNRPDLVVAALGRAPGSYVDIYRAAHRKRLERLGRKETDAVIDERIPEVKLVEFSGPDAAGHMRLALRARAIEKKLAALHITVNGVPLHGRRGLQLPGTAGWRGDVSLELSRGKNDIQISVTDEAGTESLREGLSVDRGGTVAPRLKALLIGVSRYADPDFNLQYAAKDANDLAALLASNARGFASIDIKRILDEEASKENILAARPFLEETSPDDHVIVFVAGHGLLGDHLDYFFATHDVDFAAPAARGLPYEALESLLDGLPARHKLLLIDTCHAGEIEDKVDAQVQVALSDIQSGGVLKRVVGARGFTRIKRTLPSGFDLSELLAELFADLRRSSGTVVIASSGGAEFAQESSRFRNGVFTYAILEGVTSRTADRNRNGTISVSELREHVSKVVPELTQGQQRPSVRRELVQVDFAFP